MKLFIKNSFLFIISLILLSGCVLFQKQTQEASIEKPEILNGLETPQKTFSCDMLKTEDAQKNCIDVVNSSIEERVYFEIIRTYDLNRCDELNADMAIECKEVVENSGVKGPITIEEVNMLEDALDPGNDISKCATLKTSGLKEYCEKQVDQKIYEEKMRQIIDAGDVTKCDELKGEFIKICKEEFGVYEEAVSEPENIEPGMTGEATEPAGSAEPVSPPAEVK
jgi:hypothetical protein